MRQLDPKQKKWWRNSAGHAEYVEVNVLTKDPKLALWLDAEDSGGRIFFPYLKFENCGGPQGSVLGSLRFIININDLDVNVREIISTFTNDTKLVV